MSTGSGGNEFEAINCLYVFADKRSKVSPGMGGQWFRFTEAAAIENESALPYRHACVAKPVVFVEIKPKQIHLSSGRRLIEEASHAREVNAAHLQLQACGRAVLIEFSIARDIPVPAPLGRSRIHRMISPSSVHVCIIDICGPRTPMLLVHIRHDVSGVRHRNMPKQEEGVEE